MSFSRRLVSNLYKTRQSSRLTQSTFRTTPTSLTSVPTTSSTRRLATTYRRVPYDGFKPPYPKPHLKLFGEVAMTVMYTWLFYKFYWEVTFSTMSVPASPSTTRPCVLLDLSFPKEHMEWLEERAEIILYYKEKEKSDDGNTTSSNEHHSIVELSTAVKEKVEAILWYGHSKVDSKILSQFPNVKVVSNFGVGYEHFYVPDILTKHRLPMGHTPCPDLAETTADFAWALMLSASRNLVKCSNQYNSPSQPNHLDPNAFLGKQVSGGKRTLGIVGMGAIGSGVARRANGFKIRVIYHNRSRKSPQVEKECSNAQYMESMDDLLKQADFVMLTCPLTAATHHLIGPKQFALMKSDCLFINMGRGGLVDTEALVDALVENKIWKAALDVTDPEPLPRDHPLVVQRKGDVDLTGRVLLTPHQGSATMETRFTMLTMAFDNLLAGIEGKRLPWLCKECNGKLDSQGPDSTVGECYWTK
eukprot:g492.t1